MNCKITSNIFQIQRCGCSLLVLARPESFTTFASFTTFTSPRFLRYPHPRVHLMPDCHSIVRNFIPKLIHQNKNSIATIKINRHIHTNSATLYVNNIEKRSASCGRNPAICWSIRTTTINITAATMADPGASVLRQRSEKSCPMKHYLQREPYRNQEFQQVIQPVRQAELKLP